MSKQEFLGALYNGLSGLPKEDIENSVQFYSEMIDDRMDEGMTENEAVEDIGSVNEIIQQILSESSLPKLVKRTVSKKHDWKVWEIVLLAVGSPVWFPLLLTAVVIVLTVYIVIWSVVLSFYAADFSLAVSGIFTLVSTVHMLLPQMQIYLKCSCCLAELLYVRVCQYCRFSELIKLQKEWYLSVKKYGFG